MKKILSIVTACLLVLSVCSCGKETGESDSSGGETAVKDERNLNEFDYSLMNLCGTDAVGRKVDVKDGAKTGTKYVGLFYSLWLGNHKDSQSDIYDITALLSTQEGTEALGDTQNNNLSKVNEFHFFAQPLYGYYSMNDPWVVTRHIELLTMAGIDYLCFDATNTIIYPTSAKLVLDTLLKYKKQGWNVPKVMFYTNTGSGTTVKKIYNEYYQTEKYDDIWFSPNGKPMIIGITENNANASDQTKYLHLYDYISSDMQEFFDVKESQWPNGDINENAVPWMSWQYPQLIHSDTKSISVSVAQHSPTRISFSYEDPQSSRGYDYKTGTANSDYEKGQNFQNEWNTVFDNYSKIENVLVTSWNEWMAIKYITDGQPNFCDVYNEEYSRDLEPMNGSCKDDFYMQFIENVRKYKFTDSVVYDLKKTKIDVDKESSLVQWDYVQSKYKDFEGDATARNFENAVGSFNYVDNSNRNDITDIRVAHDSENLYFYVKTADNITAYNGTDKNWMNIFVGAGSDGNDFVGYNYVLNRTPGSDGTTSVEKSNGGYSWTGKGTAKYRIYGNVMVLSVPLSTLGLSADNVSVSFKAADNVTKYDDIMDYYVTGDSAPIGRLSYHYGK